MILVDTSVWVDHLRSRNARLVLLLEENQALMHPFVFGELALGNLHKRQTVLTLLKNLPQATIADEDEVSDFIERHALYGLGIGYIDAHLLASAKLHAVKLWTRDKRLQQAATRLKLA